MTFIRYILLILRARERYALACKASRGKTDLGTDARVLQCT